MRRMTGFGLPHVARLAGIARCDALSDHGWPVKPEQDMRLEGSCHCQKIRFTVEAAQPVPFMRCYCSICRKTAGTGGYAINLGADTHSMRVVGKRYLRIYQATLQDEVSSRANVSQARRYFCSLCGSALWVWDPRWPDLVHPLAGAIDSPLPPAPENVHIMLDSKAPWVDAEGSSTDPRFAKYPSMSLAQWHHHWHLDSPAKTPTDQDVDQ